MSMPAATPYWGPDFDALAAFDPDIAERRPRRAGPAAQRPAADRQRELHQPGGARRAGQHAVEQVRRGLPRPALLRRLRGRRPGRGDRHRAGQGAVRRRARQPAAALRRERQPGRLRRVPAAGRHGSSPWRCRTAATSPTAAKVNFTGKWFNAVQYGVRPGHRAHRLRPGARPRPRAPAQADHLRRLGDPAADRLRRLPRDRRRGRARS